MGIMEKRAQPCDENRAQPCDVFISYRRKDGSATAGRLYDSLVRRGYRVFMDANLSAGQFDVQLEQRISECKDFLNPRNPKGRCVS